MSTPCIITVAITVAAEGTRLHYYWRFNGRTLPVRGHTLRFRATLRRAGTYEAMASVARNSRIQRFASHINMRSDECVHCARR